MIEADGLTKRYGDFAALNGVTFKVGAGEVVGFLGPNGAGKTTTMRILTTYMPPTSGSARVAGKDVLDEARAVRERVGYLPETPPLYPDLTVETYLRFVARLKGVPSAKRAERVEHVIARCGLESMRRRVIDTLSKGFRQRVGIAQALVHDPDVLVLDEPTVGLDPNQIIEIRKLIADLARGDDGKGGQRTVILSTHILPEVAQLCQRAIIIAGGRIVADRRLDDLPDGQSLEEFFVKVTTAAQRDAAAGSAASDTSNPAAA